MKISARNVFRGSIVNIEIGAVNAQVTIRIAPDLDMVSIITKDSVQRLGLVKGGTAHAVIKASSVMVAVD